jgi:hypothetical protein
VVGWRAAQLFVLHSRVVYAVAGLIGVRRGGVALLRYLPHGDDRAEGSLGDARRRSGWRRRCVLCAALVHQQKHQHHRTHVDQSRHDNEWPECHVPDVAERQSRARGVRLSAECMRANQEGTRVSCNAGG